MGEIRPSTEGFLYFCYISLEELQDSLAKRESC